MGIFWRVRTWPHQPETVWMRGNLIETLQAQGKLAEADSLAR